MVETADVVQLNPQTLQSFNVYIQDAESAMERTSASVGTFLWCDTSPEIDRQVREGQIVAQFWTGRRPTKVPSGLIHDWIGAAFVPWGTIKETLALIQDYDHHANIYKPDVIASKLIRHDGNDFQIYLRLLKRRIMTVVLDTDHEVHYSCLDRTRWLCRSCTTRIAEVQAPGTPKEKVLLPDVGYGFLWRLNSYWRFQERNDGVYLECRAISLTRDVPFGMGWIIEPIIQKLPKESLIHTLGCTRQALKAK
jgi:hypothetical protein